MCERTGTIAIPKNCPGDSSQPDPISVRSQLLQVAGLTNLAIAQPLFALLGDNSTFFVAHKTSTTELVLFVALLSWVLPVLGVSLVQLARLIGSRTYRSAHYALLALLFCAFGLSVARRFPIFSGASSLLMAVGFGITFAVATARAPTIRSFLSILGLAALIVPISFLGTSSALEATQEHHYPAIPYPEKNNQTPVVFLIFDALPLGSLQDPSGEVDGGLYPNFSQLAENSYWFRNTNTVSLWTDVAVPAILTGRYPSIPDRERPAAIVSNYPENLFSLFAGSRSIISFETMTQLAPPLSERLVPKRLTPQERFVSLLVDGAIVYAHILSPPDLESHLPPLFGRWKGFSSTVETSETTTVNLGEPTELFGHGERPLWARRFIASIQQQVEPSLFYFHITLPHVPYQYLPSGKDYGNVPMLPKGNFAGTWMENSWLTTLAQQRHLIQLGYTDTVLGHILDSLKHEEIYAESLLVVTSDHGAAFRAGNSNRGISKATDADTLMVPLFIKLPHQERGVIRDDNVQTIDILPTLVDVLAVETPWQFDGRSLFDDDASEPLHKQVNLLGGKTIKFPKRLSLKPSREDKLSLFGTGSWESVFAVGPFPQLIGRKAKESVQASPFSSVFFRLDAPETYQRVDLSVHFCPSYLRGFLESTDEISLEGHPLVIAVNGIILAQSAVFSLDGKLQFSAMLPESAFQNGHNSVEVFGIEKKESQLILRRIRSMAQPPS